MSAPSAETVLSASGVSVRFESPRGPILAVREVDLEIARGETVAIVGESGSGKSAFAKAILHLHQPPFTPPLTRIEGSIRLSRSEGPVELVRADRALIRRVRASEIGMIFQDALSALNPVTRIGTQVAEALRAARPDRTWPEARAAAVDILERVGLPDPTQRARHFPHQLSGGQRQRVMIAIAAIREPKLLIADEPTTALDVGVQARILKLLKDLQRSSGMAMLFITHDLGVVAEIADRVAVMYAGRIIEMTTASALHGDPRHPYTRGLLASLPGRRRRGERLQGQAPDPRLVPQGCAFRPRCGAAEDICATAPPVHKTANGWSRCWRTAA